jgi:hypothetical protein
MHVCCLATCAFLFDVAIVPVPCILVTTGLPPRLHLVELYSNSSSAADAMSSAAAGIRNWRLPLWGSPRKMRLLLRISSYAELILCVTALNRSEWKFNSNILLQLSGSADCVNWAGCYGYGRWHDSADVLACTVAVKLRRETNWWRVISATRQFITQLISLENCMTDNINPSKNLGIG